MIIPGMPERLYTPVWDGGGEPLASLTIGKYSSPSLIPRGQRCTMAKTLMEWQKEVPGKNRGKGKGKGSGKKREGKGAVVGRN